MPTLLNQEPAPCKTPGEFHMVFVLMYVLPNVNHEIGSAAVHWCRLAADIVHTFLEPVVLRTVQ